MWSTAEGDTLIWPRAWSGRFASKLRDSGLIDPALNGTDVNGLLSRIAENAYRAGTLRHRSSGRSYPVFRSNILGRDFRVVARPINDRVSAVLNIQSELEYEDKEIPTPTHKLADYVKSRPQAGKTYSGIYFIFKDGKLIYIGQALNFIRRLQHHFWCLQHLAVDAKYIQRYTVGFMELPAGTKKDRDNMRQVEKDFIKQYIGKKTATTALRNQRTELELWGGV